MDGIIQLLILYISMNLRTSPTVKNEFIPDPIGKSLTIMVSIEPDFCIDHYQTWIE